MFVPKAALTSTGSLRNPRRRQRTGSDDSVKLPSAKRQRSALRNGDTRAYSESKGGHRSSDESSGFPMPSNSDERDTSVVDAFSSPQEIPIRVLQKPEKEVKKPDSTLVLVQFNCPLPSLIPAIGTALLISRGCSQKQTSMKYHNSLHYRTSFGAHNPVRKTHALSIAPR